MSKEESKHLAERVGQAIARHRVRCELNQEQVAEMLGIGSEAVSRIERGVVMPNIGRLAELASIFGCETADLLTESGARAEDQSRKLYDLLSQLNSRDREFVMDVLERLVMRFSADAKGAALDPPGRSVGEDPRSPSLMNHPRINSPHS